MALAVAISALLTLALEVFSTRLFAVLLWKNAASAILSLALLGIGVSGALVYLRPTWFPRERRHAQVAWALVAFGVSIVASYLMLLALSRSPRSEMEPLSHFVPLVLAGMLPFCVGGLVLTIVFTHEADLPRLYRIDLVSAAVGAVLVLPALSALNGPPLVPALAAVAAIGALILAHREKLQGPRNAAVGLLVALGALSAVHAETGLLRVTHSHGTADGPIELERWGPLARMTVRPHSSASKWLDIDSQVVTAVLRFSGDPDDVDYLRKSVLQLAYHLRPFESVLVIGPGGGSDVLAALTSGAKDITAVEVNPTTVGIMRGELSNYTGGLYDRPEIHVHVADGRAYVASMRERVDLLQATFVDTFTAQASGAHTLSENYLYTVEGFGDFLDHLREDGVLSMSRWGGEAYTFAEVHRSVAIARDALDRRGVTNPGEHVVVVQGAPPEKLTLGGGYLHQAGNSESMSTLLVKTS
ncbi:MAG: hypothetical protein FJ104_15355, partial [Deltaproteobacteria bacterium]|nr:hypothetical protein [Deltaproteobacteria bacterium]